MKTKYIVVPAETPRDLDASRYQQYIYDLEKKRLEITAPKYIIERTKKIKLVDNFLANRNYKI